MFGTLIIGLPCKHEGGDLILSHHGIKKRYSTFNSGPLFAAWYSDVKHEVREVTSGHRLVLAYNLVHEDLQMRPSASSMDLHPPLKAAVKQWLYGVRHDPLDAPTELIYTLEHKYTDASLSLHNLKTHDLARARAVLALAETQGIVLYLASMQRSVSGPTEYEDRSYGGGPGGGYHTITDITTNLSLSRESWTSRALNWCVTSQSKKSAYWRTRFWKTTAIQTTKTTRVTLAMPVRRQRTGIVTQ